MFDKALYWKRRKAGKRGQGEVEGFKFKRGRLEGQREFKANNRIVRRRKAKSIKIKQAVEKYSPRCGDGMTNHERVKFQREARAIGLNN